MGIAGNSDRTVSVHFYEYSGPNIIICTFSIIQCSHLKNRSNGLDIICHLAGITTKILLHCRNYFLYWLIIPCNLFLCLSQSRFRSRDIANIVSLYDDQKLRLQVVGVPSSFLACVSSGIRRPLTFPPLQPTFRPLRQAVSNFPHSLRHSVIPSSIFPDLSRHSQSRP
jgi:hypothetical protein